MLQLTSCNIECYYGVCICLYRVALSASVLETIAHGNLTKSTVFLTYMDLVVLQPGLEGVFSAKIVTEKIVVSLLLALTNQNLEV
jgi:hypothetical protein